MIDIGFLLFFVCMARIDRVSNDRFALSITALGNVGIDSASSPDAVLHIASDVPSDFTPAA